MGWAAKTRLLLTLDRRTVLELAEACMFMGWARYSVLRSFAKLAPSLGEPMQETSEDAAGLDKAALIRVRNAVDVMSRHTFWESKCLVRAIAAMKMLERRGIESTLYLGTARDESGGMIAHAWLRCGPYIVTGAEEMQRFAVVGKFAKWGRR
jgi:hypothetical protein